MSTTTTTPVPPSLPELEVLGREYAELLASKAVIDARMKAIQDRCRTLDFGPYPAGPVRVSIQHNVTRNDAAFAKAYPFEEFPDLYKATPDTAEIKQALAPREIARFQTEGAPKVVITLYKDAQ